MTPERIDEIRRHPLLALVWATTVDDECELHYVKTQNMTHLWEKYDSSLVGLRRWDIPGNPLDLPEDVTITIERGE